MESYSNGQNELSCQKKVIQCVCNIVGQKVFRFAHWFSVKIPEKKKKLGPLDIDSRKLVTISKTVFLDYFVG